LRKLNTSLGCYTEEKKQKAISTFHDEIEDFEEVNLYFKPK